MKRLVKNENDKMISGVCSGIADYLGVDVTIVRVIWVLVTLAGGSGIILYIVAAILMPSYSVIEDHNYSGADVE